MFRKLILTALVATISIAGAASAADFTWVGNGPNLSDKWSDPNNWNINGLPSNPRTGYSGDNVFINAVTPPARDPNVGVVGAVYMALYLQSDGVLNVRAGTNGTWGLAGNGSSYNMISDGVANVWGSWTMAQNLYIAHTDTAGSYGTVNIYNGGTIRTQGVLTIGGRQGNGELNIYNGALYILGNGIRWNYLTAAGNTYNSHLNIYPGGTMQWINNRTGSVNAASPAGDLTRDIRDGYTRAGVIGYEVKGSYDANTNYTIMTVARYLRAYLPVYTPALLNDGVNINRVMMTSDTGTIGLSWTKPMASNPSKPITNTAYFGQTNPPTGAILTASEANSVSSVPIEKSKTYYWKVDSTDPNTGVTTAGDVWTFDTQNVAPIAAAETSPVRIWFSTSTATTTLHATVTDDGYPLPTPTYTYRWEQVDTNDVLPGPVTTQDVTISIPSSLSTARPITRSFRVTASDGSTGPAYTVEVRAFDTPCLAGKDVAGVTVGDIWPLATTTPAVTAGDCVVNFKDVAQLCKEWLTPCKIYDGVCPL
jgi:hypothetical protein